MRWRAVFLIPSLLSATGVVAESFALDLSPRAERAFFDDTPFVLDIDGDGRSDVIWPRTFEFRRWRIAGVPPADDGRVERFQTFDLEAASGRRLFSFFRFRVGTENGGYASYSLQRAGDVDGDGRPDLAFHVGAGERPEELVLLLDRETGFAARTTGPLRCACEATSDLQIVARGGDGERLARWDSATARFRGESLVWVIGAAGRVRSAPQAAASLVVDVPGGLALRRLPEAGDGTAAPGWLRVEVDGVGGWISGRMVEPASPEEWR